MLIIHLFYLIFNFSLIIFCEAMNFKFIFFRFAFKTKEMYQFEEINFFHAYINKTFPLKAKKQKFTNKMNTPNFKKNKHSYITLFWLRNPSFMTLLRGCYD